MPLLSGSSHPSDVSKVYGLDPGGSPLMINAASLILQFGGGCSIYVESFEAVPAQFLFDLADEITLPLHLEEVASPAQAAAQVISELESQVAAAGPKLAGELEDAIEELEEAIVELAMTPPDQKSAALHLEAAVRELEAPVKNGLPVGDAIALMDDVVGVSRQLASDTIMVATAEDGDPRKIAQADSLLTQGDSFRASGQAGAYRSFRPASRKYRDSLTTADQAIG